MGSDPVLQIRGVTKDYRGLRPLRIADLTIVEGESVAILGLDRVAAEVLVNLITGATVPDSGSVTVFGQSTSEISDGDAWLASLDRFGILSGRAVLLEQFSVAQNLAVPFSLQLNQISPAVAAQVEALARAVGLGPTQLPRAVADVDADVQLRIRLGRAVALGPRILLAEHPNALIPAESVSRFAADFARVVAMRHLASLTMTSDGDYAENVAARVLTVQPATGELRAQSGWRRWF